MISPDTPCTAFEGSRCIGTGPLSAVARSAKAAIDRASETGTSAPVLVFADATSEVIELDWRGSLSEFDWHAWTCWHRPPGQQAPRDPQTAATLAADGAPPSAEAARGPGRPKLGVVAREVTLLPRHWEWLASQPGGASVALRKLVEVARRSSEVKDRVRQAGAVAYRFMSTMAGHEPGFRGSQPRALRRRPGRVRGAHCRLARGCAEPPEGARH
jgi:hypothetical protein